MKVAAIVGARPQFIKAAVVSKSFSKLSDYEEVLVHTGQHYDSNMSDIFFTELGIPSPTYNLNVGSCSHGTQTGRMLEAVEKVLIVEQPDWVLVYGDTNSTLAGALAAVKLHIPVGHVEAGLRAHNLKMPEEVNRIVADHVSTLLLAPSLTAVSNLRSEGIDQKRVHFVGDVMYDSILHYSQIAADKSGILTALGLRPRDYVLATVHRAENTDNMLRLRAIWTAFNELARDIRVIFPLHPRTKLALQHAGYVEPLSPGLTLIDPVGYLDMIELERNACVVASDSGGVPKEAYFLGTPSVILRPEAVWEELVDLGWADTVDPVASQNIIRAIMRAAVPTDRSHARPFGDGDAAGKIVDLLLKTRL